MENNIVLPNIDNLSFEMLADMLGLDIEDIYDLTLEQLSDLTIKHAEEKSKIINGILDNRNSVHTVVKKAQEEYGITPEDLSVMYFEEIEGVNQ